MVVGIPASDIRKNFPAISAAFDDFTANGATTVETLLEDIQMRTRQCWIVVSPTQIFAVVLTQIGDDDLKTCRLTHWSGSDVRKWHHLIADLEAWATRIGCRNFEIYAPMRGIVLAESYGYVPSHVIMEKRLDAE